MADEQRSAQDLVRYLRGRGITTGEIASELNRDPRMVRKILNGETSGALYREALEELATTGKVTSIPPRRRRRDGTLARVRGRKGDQPVVPEDPALYAREAGNYTTEKQGGRLHVEVGYMAEGGRLIQMRIPKGRTAKGRAQANAELLKQVRNAAKGQARDNQKQITARLTFSNGRTMEVNTYNASTMLKRINDNGGDGLGWLREEAKNRYLDLDTSRETVTSIQLNVFATPKTDEYAAQSARGRVRRTRRLAPAEIARMEEKARIEEHRSRRGRRWTDV